MKVTIKIDKNINIQEKIPEIQNKIIQLSGIQLETIVKQNTPVDAGHLRSTWIKKEEKNQVTLSTSAKYAEYLNEGTGIYGPRRTPITPKNKKALKWKKGGNIIFAKKSKGIQGKHFIEKSVKELEKKIPTIAQQAIREL